MKNLVISLFILFLFANTVLPATVVLKSGETYVGKIVEETSEYLRLKTNSKILRIRRSAIATITLSDQPQEPPAVMVETKEARTVSEPSRLGPEFYGGAGLSFPAGPDVFTDYWRMGFNFGAGMGFLVSPNLSFVGNIDYSSFTFDDDKFLEAFGFQGYGISISGGEASVFTLSGNLKASLLTRRDPVRPYFSGGVGLFILSLGDVTMIGPGAIAEVEGDSETALSVLLGAGVDFAIAKRINLFIEGKYVVGFTEDESTQIFPLKVGIKSSWSH